MALLKEQEAICLELGNLAGLAHCYWKRGLLARERDTKREKPTAALNIFTNLNMPRERDAVLAEVNMIEAGSQGI
jgi:hypothetical protein